MYEHHSQKLLPFGVFLRRMLFHVSLAASVGAGSLFVGILGYHELAHMGWVDSYLNASMILGGMGPIGELPNDASKIFAGSYALYSGVVFIAVAGLVIAPVAHRVLHKLHVSK